MAIDGQVCFHTQPFAVPVRPLKYTTGSLGPVNGINKDVSSIRLLPTTVLTYPMDWVCLCHLHKTKHCWVCPSERYNPPLATHPPTPITHPTHPYNVPTVVLQSLNNMLCIVSQALSRYPGVTISELTEDIPLKKQCQRNVSLVKVLITGWSGLQ